MTVKSVLKDYRFISLAGALLAIVVLFAHPFERRPSRVFNLTLVVDITRSMNVEDQQIDGEPVSRLAFVKQRLRDLLLTLPCDSTVGLGVFTERHSTVLFEPIEVCSGFAELDTAIAALDWRMAWAADSRIAKGLSDAIEQRRESNSVLIFMTDGHEAPPVNPRYRTEFSNAENDLQGMIVGVGGARPAPIPKYDNRGERNGFYTADDVPHRSSFGLSNLNPEEVEGYHARNAPFGSEAPVGNEHLSYLHEAYLQELANKTGFSYHHLVDAESFASALLDADYAEQKTASIDVRWRAALAALILLLAVFV
ncbi:MAG: hypothetical protein Kow0065_17210 [Methylomicrobium sp.]